MEVRFESNLDEAAVFGVIYNTLKNEFVKTQDLPVLQLPATLRKSDPNLIFQPYYRLESKTNKNILIQVGPKVFSVAITNDYTGWEEFLKYINLGLSKLEESGVVSKINRMALRYLNFFDGNVLSKSNLSITLNDKLFNGFNSQFRIEIPDGEFIHGLSINNNVLIEDPTGLKSGSIIDIDTFIEKSLLDFFSSKDKLLEDCHDSEKRLFSSLLSDEYVKTLKEVSYE